MNTSLSSDTTDTAFDPERKRFVKLLHQYMYNTSHLMVYLKVGWSVGSYDTVALYRPNRADECEVNVTVNGWVSVSSWWSCATQPNLWGCTTLHPRVVGEFSAPIRLGFDGVIPFYTPEQWAYSFPPAHMGQLRYYDITHDLSKSAGGYAVW